MSSLWTDRSWRINRMMWRFKTSRGFGGETWPYDELPAPVEKVMRGSVALREHEVALVAYFHDAETWTLLTSDRIMGSAAGKAFDLDLQTIDEARFGPKGFRILADAPGTATRRLVETMLVTAGERTCTVSIEGPLKSAPQLGLLNVLKMLLRMA